MARRKKTEALPPDKFLQVVKALNDNKVRFLIAGARAVAFHGYSRFTHDYDICVAPDPAPIDGILDVFYRLGFRFAEPVDAIMIAQSVNVHLVAEIDIDLLIRPKGFSFEEAWQRRVSVEMSGCLIHFVSKEDLIAMKRAVGRPQDLLDIEHLKDE